MLFRFRHGDLLFGVATSFSSNNGRLQWADGWPLTFQRFLELCAGRTFVEADVVLGIGSIRTIVEVKSSMTAGANILGGARRVRGLLMAPSIDFKIRVVYGGDDFQAKSDALIIPWSLVHEQEWS